MLHFVEHVRVLCGMGVDVLMVFIVDSDSCLYDELAI